MRRESFHFIEKWKCKNTHPTLKSEFCFSYKVSFNLSAFLTTVWVGLHLPTRMTLTKTALVALLLIMILLPMGESQYGQWQSKTIQQKRCYSCRCKHFSKLFLKQIAATCDSWLRSRGPLGDCGDEFVTYNHSSQVNEKMKHLKFCKKLKIYCFRWLKNPVHQDGVSNKKRDKTQRFLPKKHILHTFIMYLQLPQPPKVFFSSQWK